MKLLAPRDVARRLNLSVSRVTQLDREGVLPALRDASGRRIYLEERVAEFERRRDARRGATVTRETPDAA